MQVSDKNHGSDMSLQTCKDKRIQRLCKILKSKGKEIDLDGITKLTRDKIDQIIFDEVEQPYQRY